MNKFAFVLLPGLDGTGLLTRDFVDALGVDAETHVVSYPSDRNLDYGALIEFARTHLPRDGPYLLIAESFSGPVACALAASRPKGLAGLVLCASFASTPFPLLRRLSFLFRVAPVRAVPTAVLTPLLLGRWSSPALVAALGTALRSVAPAVLRGRAQLALGCFPSASLGQVEVPVLYLRASEDRLVPRSAFERLLHSIPSASMVTVEGPHFLLQAVPSACAAAIQSFLISLEPKFQTHG